MRAVTVDKKTISEVMSELARRSNRNVTEAQKSARAKNAEKARKAREAKRKNLLTSTTSS